MDISNIKAQSSEWIRQQASGLGIKLSAQDVRSLKSMSYEQIAQEVAKMPVEKQLSIIDLVARTQPVSQSSSNTNQGVAVNVSAAPSESISNKIMLDLITNTGGLNPDSLQALARQEGVPDYISNTYKYLVDSRVHAVVLPDGGTAYQLDGAYAINQSGLGSIISQSA